MKKALTYGCERTFSSLFSVTYSTISPLFLSKTTGNTAITLDSGIVEEEEKLLDIPSLVQTRAKNPG